MAEATIDSFPDDEREAVRSETSAIRSNMTGENSTTPV